MSDDETTKARDDTDPWREMAMTTAHQIVNLHRPTRTNVQRLAKEFIVQRLIEDGLRATNARLVALLEIDDATRKAISRMRARHSNPVDDRPTEISHDRAPILEHFARIDAELGDA